MQMRKVVRLFVAVGLTVALAGEARAADADVRVESDAKAGKYLADGEGMALYLFKKDSPEKSACAGPCVQAWPIFHREKVHPGEGLDASGFGTITRDDGQKQTTYKKMPLYYFARDERPGDTKGHGVNEVWVLAAP
jgi:predicted lipoprotein with Yx(FWY)xxD motif